MNLKRSASIYLLAEILATTVLAEAGAAPRTRAPKPVAHTLYLEGSTRFGEQESFLLIQPGYLPLTPLQPQATESKSKQITNFIFGPNDECAGNNLFPVWSGNVTGRIVGDIDVTLHTIATPGRIGIRVWPDIDRLVCNDGFNGPQNFPEPEGEVAVDLPAGEGVITATIEDVDFTAEETMIVQVSPLRIADVPLWGGAIILPPFVARVLYGSEAAPSSITLRCVPPSRAASCIET